MYQWKPRILVAIASALALSLFVDLANGQQKSNESRIERITSEHVQLLLTKARESTELDEETRKRIISNFEQALQALKGADEAATQLAAFTEMETSPSRQLEQTSSQLEAAKKPLEFPKTLSELEQLIELQVEQLTTEKKRLEGLAAEPKRRADRRSEIPQLMVAAREELAQVQMQIEAESESALKDQVAESRRVRLMARKQELQLIIPMLEQELTAYIATTKLLAAQTELASKTASRLEEEIIQLREESSSRQQRAADQKIREAQRMKASEFNPAVKQLLDEYAKLTEEAKQVNSKLTGRQTQLDASIKTLESWNRRIKRTEDRTKVGGRSQAVGLLLRRELTELPTITHSFANSNKMVSEIGEVQLRYLELLDRQSDLSEEPFVKSIVDKALRSSPDENDAEVKAAVEDILRMEKELLTTMVPAYDAYLDRLGKYDEKQEELDKTLAGYRTFINERIFWIQSSTVASLADTNQIQKTSNYFLSGSSWQKFLSDLLADAQKLWPLYLLFAGLFFVAARVIRNARRALDRIGEQIAEHPLTPIKSTFAAVALSFVAAAPAPLLILFAAWRCNSFGEAQLGKHISAGLVVAAVLVLALEFLRRACRPNGLIQNHFQYSEAAVAYTYRFTRRLLFAIAPFVFAIWTIESWSGMTGDNPISRLALIATCLIFIVAAHWYFWPKGIVFQSVEETDPTNWWVRFRWPNYLLAIGIPTALMAASIIGFHYTSLRLIQKIQPTLILIFGLLLIGNVLARWLRLGIAELSSTEPPEEPNLTGLEDPLSTTVPTEDTQNAPVVVDSPSESEANEVMPPQLTSLTTESRLLLDAMAITALFFGLWVIWVDVFPAMRILQQFELWETTSKVTREIVGADGLPRVETVEQLVPITLLDLGKAIFGLLLMFVFLRTVPIFLELTLLNRLPINDGSRYAIKTVFRWGIIMIGLIAVASFLGFTWAKIQWLAAAVTIGLGFGLQEIFANFVSGLILLAERPVRVGDVVTIGDVTGRVNRIQMRATTIRDWKKKELVVPNKELVTGQVFNWTLSDDIFRLDFPVALAYGVDTAIGRRIMLDIARRHRHILKEPEPRAIFLGFKDCALQLELRVFIRGMEEWFNVMSEVNTAIAREFKRAGLELSTPTNDIFVRSIDEEIVIRQPTSMDEDATTRGHNP